MPGPRIAAAAAFGVLALGLTGCGSAGPQVQTRSGAVALVAGSSESGMDALFHGAAAVNDSGCWGVVAEGGEHVPLIWPEADGLSVDVPGLGRVDAGRLVSASGGEVELAGNDSLSDVPDECRGAGRVISSWKVSGG